MWIVYKEELVYTVDMTETNLSSKKVFIVEDDTFLGKMLVQNMSEHVQVALYPNGEEALSALKTESPDMLVLDVFLPGVNGLDLLDQLRKDERTKNLKVLVVSNTDEKKDRDRATSLGATFLIKAMTDPQDIVDAVLNELKK